MPVPVFTAGETLDASEMNAVGLWRVTGCTVTSAGGTAATASNGVITIGTGNTSVTVANAFSTDYDSYRIIYQDISGSTPSNLTIYFSGITGSVYSTGGTFFTFGSTTVSGFGPAATTSWIVGPGSSLSSNVTIDVMSPFLSKRKTFTGQGVSDTSLYHFGGYCNSTTSATGFVLSPSAGTITGGTLRVYGYRK